MKKEPADHTLSTDELFQTIKQKIVVDENQISFVELKQLKQQLKQDITVSPFTQSRLCEKCGILPSHLTEFLNKDKNLSRDRLLCIFITLGYDIDRTQKNLSRFGVAVLYPRNARDYTILKGIRDRKSITEIDMLLYQHNLKTLLEPEAKKHE